MDISLRTAALNQISQYILRITADHPIRVGIDGITASGKSTLAKQLAETLEPSGRPIISTTLDGFHNPKEIRHRKGRDSAEGYYYDAYNYPAIIENLLAPMDSKGNLLYKTQVLDLKEDCALDEPSRLASTNSILIVDGSFALRKELVKFWDVSILIDVDFEIAENRASVRDAVLFTSAEIARDVTRKRYHGAHKIHAEVGRPKETATFVIDNNDPLKPSLSLNLSTNHGVI